MKEVTRSFFGKLYQTYSFFTMYANVDGFTYAEPDVPLAERPELDRWILSALNTLVKNVNNCLNDYEPTKAGRLIQDFVIDNVSTWFVRLSRKRFWGSEQSTDKLSAYQTLYTCLETAMLYNKSWVYLFHINYLLTILSSIFRVFSLRLFR